MVKVLRYGGCTNVANDVYKRATLVNFSDNNLTIKLTLFVEGRRWKTVDVNIPARGYTEVDIAWFVNRVCIEYNRNVVTFVEEVVEE